MNKKFKFLTVLLALVMTLGAFAPFSAVKAADESTETESVTVHKILLTAAELKAHDVNKEYNGKQIQDINNFFGAKNAQDIGGVYFKLQKLNDGVKDNEIDVNNDSQWTDVEGKAGLTVKDNGYKFDTKGLSGKFRLVEVHEKSTYKGENGETLTDSKAVPTLITLPLVNNDGIVKDAHVYPKNTEEKPKIDKNFSADEAKKYMSDEEKTKLDNAIAHKAAFEKAKKLYATTSTEYTTAEAAYTPEDKALIEKWGIDFEANTRGKQTINKKIGDDVEYTVVTDIPAQTKWATAKWDDKMTEGLTYNKDLSIKLEILNEEGNYTEVVLTKDTDYTLTETKDGFVLNFEKPGLDKLNNKAQSQIVTLKYSAKINNTTVTDVPESNDVTFHYGNTPGKGNTPIPNKPKDGKITVTKTMKDGQEWPEKGIQVQLVNANTGENVGQPVTLTGTKTTHTWENLDAETEYKVVELTTGYDVVYGKGADNALGQISIDNYKTDNPEPLNPSEPKVITGGKKFVKTNQDKTERLAGAEFYVRDGKTEDAKYLVAKTVDESKVAAARKALKYAKEAYEALTPEQQKGEDGKKAKEEFDKKQLELNQAVLENATAYTWGEKDDKDVVILTSNEQGQFEITGLAYGTYYLKEKTAPKDYALREDFIEFVVKEGSYGENSGNIDYVKESKENDALCVTNKKVTIPQTGGIGTVIFTVVGVMLMVGAAFALKRRKEDELEGLA